ncbi:hypothetical protein AU191_08785 [Mycolicibacterium acapulense]|nr:hypothetical protein AU191_08785 [Mycolicibacterium acapulense]
MSFDALAASLSIIRTLPSSGVLRFSGDGVPHSAAPLSEVTRALHHFQRLTTAIVAAEADDKELGKQASVAVQRKSRLLIAGSPGQGSVVFNIVPEMRPAEEVGDGPDGAVSMFRDAKDDDQQVDRAVGEAINLISMGNDLPPDLMGSPFIDGIVNLGPRTAACMRDFTRTIHRSQFDVDLEWRQPARPTARVHLGAAKADLIAQAIERSEIDTQPVTIEGRVLTVSMVESQQWLIEPNEGQPIAVKHAALPPEQTVGIATNDRVRITAQMKTSVTTAGVAKTTYDATRVERISDGIG